MNTNTQALLEALEEIVSTHEMYCEHHKGVSQHSYDLYRIAIRALSQPPAPEQHGGERTTADEMAYDLWELYGKAAKISGSALLAGEKCPASDKAALYRIACELLGGIACVYSDVTGHFPNFEAAHKAAEPAGEAVAVPHGWKLVPLEPTSAMVAAARNTASNTGCYRAMLSVSPEFIEL